VLLLFSLVGTPGISALMWPCCRLDCFDVPGSGSGSFNGTCLSSIPGTGMMFNDGISTTEMLLLLRRPNFSLTLLPGDSYMFSSLLPGTMCGWPFAGDSVMLFSVPA
jgi:hypothetical protein